MLFLIGFRVRLIQFYWCDPLDALFFRRDESSGSGTIQRLSYSRVRIADRRRVFMNLAIWQAIKQRSRRSLIRIWVNGMPKGGRLLLTVQVVAVFLASIAMSLALAHALELPGKMRLSKENYIATQTIYYPGFTIGGASEGLSMLAVLILLFLTPANIQAFWWTLAGLIGLAAMHAVYWTLTHPVNKFWTKGMNLKGVSGGFFAVGGRLEAAEGTGDSGEKWKIFRNRWEYSHVFRAALSAAALVWLIVAVAVRGNG
jgi:hypothetical protein